jgi:hypothetical protein
MYTKDLLEEVRDLTLSDLELVNKKLVYLNDEQLSWKPSENVWNIKEILAHLNEYAKFYHTAFIERIAKTSFKSPGEVFISSPLGRSAWKSMKLGNAKNVKRRFKAMRSYNPSTESSLITGNEIATIQIELNEFLKIIELSANVSLRRVKIPISISKIIRLRLGDALLFVTYHNERHFQQISNLMALRDFPKK